MCLVWFVLAERRPFDAIWKIINTSSRSHSISKVKGWSSNTVCHTNVPSVEFFSKKNDNNNKRRKKKEKFRAQQKLGAAWKQLFAYFTDDIPYVSDGNKQNRGEGEE